jgi:hypothetical protein
LAFNLSITSAEQEISAKQFLAVNLRGAFDMAAAISAQGSHFETFAQLRDQFLTTLMTGEAMKKCTPYSLLEQILFPDKHKKTRRAHVLHVKRALYNYSEIGGKSRRRIGFVFTCVSLQSDDNHQLS